LTPCTDQNGFSNEINIFNADGTSWSTAMLSTARARVAATSLPNFGLAMFAGGTGLLLHFILHIVAGSRLCEMIQLRLLLEDD
jgi:hypothetical protein